MDAVVIKLQKWVRLLGIVVTKDLNLMWEINIANKGRGQAFLDVVATKFLYQIVTKPK